MRLGRARRGRQYKEDKSRRSLVRRRDGQTLTALLAYGSEEEQAATSPDDISPLFTGGKGNYINSVTTLCAPHNGTTLAYIIDGMNMAELGKAACYAYAG